MVIFHSYVNLPEGNWLLNWLKPMGFCCFHQEKRTDTMGPSETAEPSEEQKLRLEVARCNAKWEGNGEKKTGILRKFQEKLPSFGN